MSNLNKKLRNKTLDLDAICRVCLSEREYLRDIFSLKIPMMFYSCTSLELSEEDDLPKQICTNCFREIKRCFLFKKKVQRSNRILHSYVQQLQTREQVFSDILDKAVMDAEIIKNSISSDSEDDIPLSKIKIEPVTSQPSTNLQVGRNLLEPPPLVPLKYSVKLEKKETEVKVLPDNTPPLIPIKPIKEFFVNYKPDSVDLQLECHNCHETFDSVHTFRHHKMKMCRSPELQCNICKKEFTEKKKLIGHLKGHIVSKDYQCKVCDKKYPNASTFRVHLRTHTGERPFRCQICDKGFIRWSGVVGHMKSHTDSKPYKCTQCGNCFKNNSNLERHKVLHANILPYCCSYCGKTFSQSDNLQLHVRASHTNERPYLCNECGKSFVSHARLKRHMHVHTGYRPYRCRVCPKTYMNSADRTTHERNHAPGLGSDSGKKHLCTACGKKFSHACRLIKHMRVHQTRFRAHE